MKGKIWKKIKHTFLLFFLGTFSPNANSYFLTKNISLFFEEETEVGAWFFFILEGAYEIFFSKVIAVVKVVYMNSNTHKIQLERRGEGKGFFTLRGGGGSGVNF